MFYFTIISRQLFATKSSIIIFVVYILLFVNQGILIKASQIDGNKYGYNIISMVILTELLKLIICLGFYSLKRRSISLLIGDLRSSIRIGLLYLLPAFLYCLYNNLSYINLANYDPTTYIILMQFRNVLTGLLFQILFRKKLTLLQWISLVLLTFGCIVKELGKASVSETVTSHPKRIQNNTIANSLGLSADDNEQNGVSILNIFSWNLFLILIQMFCSCFAGVYTEYLLKFGAITSTGKRSKNLDFDSSFDHNHQYFSSMLFLQNVYLYLDSILCNICLLMLSKSLNQSYFTSTSMDLFDSEKNSNQICNLLFLQRPIHLFILFNGAIAGITTSFFLKNLNSIIKMFASTIEILISAIVCHWLFKSALDIYTLISITIVIISICLYLARPIRMVSENRASILPKEDKTSDIEFDRNRPT
ncbi:CMP-sialic acid transporter 1 [Sarcoptes scabiei]|uniref:CMP-sialic acid transporter 1 n=1 Tax=Sarcoptes scabiei TaxID=52283 RepID=A0A834VA86_SARSC|nr:CMP-sialic acid transporter 1 [Sarcoptes scabiei]